MASDLYKALQDVSIPKALAHLRDDIDGNPVYQTEGHTYAAGDPVPRADISPSLLDDLDSGKLDAFLEPATEDDFEEFILPALAPEHELERLAFEEQGKETLSQEEIIERNTRNLEEDKAAIEEAKESGSDKRNLFLAKRQGAEEDSTESDTKPKPAPKPKPKPGTPKADAAGEADGN